MLVICNDSINNYYIAFIVTGKVNNLIEFSRVILSEIEKFNVELTKEELKTEHIYPLSMRCGIHAGSLLCGVVGLTRPRFQVQYIGGAIRFILFKYYTILI